MAGGPAWGVFEQSGMAPSTVPGAKGPYPKEMPKQKKKVLGQGRARKKVKGKKSPLAAGQGSGADSPAPLITNSTSGTVIGGPGTP